MFGSTDPSQWQRLTASGMVKSGKGQLRGIFVSSGTPTLTVYDGTSTSGKLIINATVTTVGQMIMIPAIVNAGIYVALSGTGDVTVFYD